jgi:L-aspartate oxidase
VVVIGAGIAGLSVALSIRDRPVLLLTRGAMSRSGSSPWAQGGIAASWLPEDSPESHARDTMYAGSEENDREAVEVLTARAREAIDWLIECGVEFDQGADGPALCLEGGHSHHRILHAGGDSSGRVIVAALTRQVCAASNIGWQEHVEVDGLLMRAGHVCGVRVRTSDEGCEIIEAAAVVIATGGVGALYQWTSNPPECDGTGLVLGMLAGAQSVDLEFVQFHPTVLCPSDDGVQSRLPLISEAVRGAGAVLIDESDHRLMAEAHPLKDLAPRDVVARAVWRARQSGHQVFLDARAVGSQWEQRFPTIFEICSRHGIDPRRDPIPVVAAAHFHMGGLRVDLDGRTGVPGLHAVGEVACNRVHGANRLASNSLLEGVIFGRRLGALLATAPHGNAPASAPVNVVSANRLDAERFARLRAWMWAALGPERERGAMHALFERIRAEEALACSCQGILAAAMLHSAIARTQSVGAHFRRDAGSSATAPLPAMV